MNRTIKNMLHIGLAYLGVVIGAGFASGKEMLQYFVSFGQHGIWGIALASVLFMLGGIVLLQFGSYFQANEHSEVLDEISTPFISKLIDFMINFNLFATGFIMIAGAGTNLQEQFGLPIWVGAVLLSLMVVATAFMDVDKVTTLIGAITPFVIVFMLGILVYTLMNQPLPLGEALDLAAAQPTTLPHWLVSTLNYTSLTLMLAISMAVVIGGEQYSPRQAGYGGFLGGALVGALLFASFFTITLNIDVAADSSMPLLTLFNNINPTLGLVMSLIIFGMIYNTAIGTFYALAKRVSKRQPQHFARNMILLVAVGFCLSFIGFETLVAYLFPAIGYFGIFVIGLILYQWIQNYRAIRRETRLRQSIIQHELNRRDDDYDFDSSEAIEMYAMMDASNISNAEIHEAVQDLGEELSEETEPESSLDQ